MSTSHDQGCLSVASHVIARTGRRRIGIVHDYPLETVPDPSVRRASSQVTRDGAAEGGARLLVGATTRNRWLLLIWQQFEAVTRPTSDAFYSPFEFMPGRIASRLCQFRGYLALSFLRGFPTASPMPLRMDQIIV
jgi:hypothetical protein